MSDLVATRIAEILERRAGRAVELRARRDAWASVGAAFRGLESAIGDLAVHPSSPPAVRLASESLAAADLPRRIEREVLPRLQLVENRFSRKRINIGVAGKARVGKSTLLQAISGLDDDQIPTGDNLSVTAVRSRIFHSATRQRALVSFHDWASFRATVLQPYWTRLGWGSCPATALAFSKAELPPIPKNTEDATVRGGLRDRVKSMQDSVDLYKDFLTGLPKEIELAELRRFVAYPSNEEVKAGTPARLHLTVREVEIECTFPGVSVQALGLIDLPGTGENVAAGEDRHVAGLEDEVDVVLLVVKPPRVLEWDLECDATLDLIRQARCGSEAEDFAILVLNRGDASASQCGALRDHMERKLRDEDGKFKYRILEIDAKNAANVRSALTLPVLEHLATRLPAMDRAAMHHAEAGWTNLAVDAIAQLAAVDRALTGHVPVTTPAQLLVARKAHDLHGALAVALSRRVKTRFDAARLSAAEDPKFEEAVAACYQRVRAWVTDGLGRGEAEFLDVALKAMTVEQASGHAGKELNRIRVHLASEFTSLDDHLAAKVEEVWAEVWSAVAPAFGRSADAAPKDGLAQFATDLRTAGCTALAVAVDDLLALRLDYRTHFHPRLRRKLDVLSAQERDPESGAPRPRISVEPDLDGAHEMLRLLAEHGERAAHEAQNALLRDLSLPAEVLHAALEQFDDGFIRAGGAGEEFHRYALERRDEIWPNTFDQLDQAHRLFTGCRNALSSARSVLSQVQEVSK